MKANIRVFWIIAGFFYLMAVVYTVWHIMEYAGAVEWAGSVALTLVGAMATMIAFYLGLVQRSAKGVYPEDRPDGEIADADPELGHFSPWSWWPVLLAAGASVLIMGLAINMFLIPIGAALTLVFLVGWVYEYYRGNFGH